ncbi:hypothetical protein [Neoaquamicrobium sediminum]|uniref:Uncharacterized protein n=1 Tax=Neoaquamicrobium sediminum TaxID=1849104 RepID=A0ABV3X0C6_9HYPH
MKRLPSRTVLSFLLSAGFAATLMSSAMAGTIAPCSGVGLLRPPAAAVLESVPPNPAGCGLGRRFPVEAGVTLWRCRVDVQDAPDSIMSKYAWSHALLVMREGQPIQSYRDTLADGRFDAWHVLRVDLDADGAEEQVVALWNGQETEWRINSWTIHVFSNTWQPLGWYGEVHDWGPSSIVSAIPGRAGCDIALTSYEDEGTGSVVLEAGFVRLEGGRLAEASDRPRARRPLGAELQHERAAHFGQDENRAEGDITAWLGKSIRSRPN